MRIGTILVLVAVGLGAACKKSSPEFHQAQLQYDRLTSNEGDDAYLMPEMEQVSALLSQVPPNAIEVDRARALQAKIAAETARVRAERDAEQQARVEVPVAAPPPSTGSTPAPVVDVAPAPVLSTPDAGELVPYAGMPLAEFQKAFGDCVRGERPFDRGGQVVPSYPVIESAPCLKKLKVPGETVMLFVDGKLAGTATLNAAGRAERARQDAGASAPPQPEFILVPGAPVPPGFTGIPGSGVMPGATPPPPSDQLPSGAPSGTIQPRTN